MTVAEVRTTHPSMTVAINNKIWPLQATINGETPCRDWRPVIAGMGLSGWELATIVQTPLLVQSSFTTYTMKLLMVFQRRIHPQHRKATEEYIHNYQMEKLRKDKWQVFKNIPKGYNTMPVRRRGRPLPVSGSQLSNALAISPRLPQHVRFPDDPLPQRPTTGYYNHTLGRFIYPVDEPIDEEEEEGAVGSFIPNGIPPGELMSQYSSPSLGPVIRGKRWNSSIKLGSITRSMVMQCSIPSNMVALFVT